MVVRELGFANLSMGALAIASLFVPGWTLAAAFVGGIFYLLAMISDGWAAVVLGAYLIGMVFLK